MKAPRVIERPDPLVWVTFAEAARLTGLSRNTVRSYVYNKCDPFPETVKFGGRTFIRREFVLALWGAAGFVRV